MSTLMNEHELKSTFYLLGSIRIILIYGKCFSLIKMTLFLAGIAGTANNLE